VEPGEKGRKELGEAKAESELKNDVVETISFV
jgi:hypothetical protein